MNGAIFGPPCAFKNVFLTFYDILQVAPPNVARPRVTYLLLSLSTGLGALIMLKKLML